MIPAPGEMGGVGGRWAKFRQAGRLQLIEATAGVFAKHGYENSLTQMWECSPAYTHLHDLFEQSGIQASSLQR
jgi:hypothetical protein